MYVLKSWWHQLIPSMMVYGSGIGIMIPILSNGTVVEYSTVHNAMSFMAIQVLRFRTRDEDEVL